MLTVMSIQNAEEAAGTFSINTHPFPSPECRQAMKELEGSGWDHWSLGFENKDGISGGDKIASTQGDGRIRQKRIPIADNAFAQQRSRREDSSASFLTAALTSTSTFARQLPSNDLQPALCTRGPKSGRLYCVGRCQILCTPSRWVRRCQGFRTTEIIERTAI